MIVHYVKKNKYVSISELAFVIVLKWNEFSIKNMSKKGIYGVSLSSVSLDIPKVKIDVLVTRRAAPEKFLKNTGRFIGDWMNMSVMHNKPAVVENQKTGKFMVAEHYECEIQVCAN